MRSTYLNTLLALPLCAALHAGAQTHNVLTPAEQQAGYTLLFNGTDMTGWRTWNSLNPPTSWIVTDDSTAPGNKVLRINNATIQHLVSVDSTYLDFDIKVEYHLVSAANSGLFIRYNMHGKDDWGASAGPEAQISSSNHSDNGLRNRNGTAYEMFPIQASAANWDRPNRDGAQNNYGMWQQFRVIAHGRRIAHFGNGLKLLEYEMHSPAWETAFTNSKYSKDARSMTGYRDIHPGSFYFQHHGSDAVGIRFRNIRAKKLTESPWAAGSPYLVDPADSTSGLRDLAFDDNIVTGAASIRRGAARETRVDLRRAAGGLELAFGRDGDWNLRVDDLRGRAVHRATVRGGDRVVLPAAAFAGETRVLRVAEASGSGEAFHRLVAPLR